MSRAELVVRAGGVVLVTLAVLFFGGWVTRLFHAEQRERTFRECMRIRPVAECSMLLPEAPCR